ncbi:hypothetical protein FCM35_KLT17129 [Carex littledalei]|uniref:Uncharacterized protein n=1 Tax=Carex littledalei TaxID=544730 RepID=A0A833VFX9_9POAL|nr:hypothetical protein FCM35_KLT17129 [Carex littledalei]
MPISSLSLLYSSFSFSKYAPTFISPTKDTVYVAAVPLRAAPGPAQMMLSTAYNFDFGHHHLRLYVVLLFDFQPKDPENIFAALAVISQKKLPGVILKREITRIPRTRCWFVGFSKGNTLEIANRFNQNWSTDLVVGTNDCRHYTNGLVECLTGEENVLESLKN